MKRKTGHIFILSGPSGSGKTTIARRILQDKDLKSRVSRTVSFTTRAKRSGERQGKDYFFITKDKFRKLLSEKKILEWTIFLGYYYGTPRELAERKLKKGKSLILCLDYKGVLQLKRFFPNDCTAIFIRPPSVKELHNRIRNRCSKTKKEEIHRRLRLAGKEMALAKKYDYSLLNKNLEQVTKRLKNIILEKTEK